MVVRVPVHSTREQWLASAVARELVPNHSGRESARRNLAIRSGLPLALQSAVLGAFVEGSTGAAQTGATRSASRRRSRPARPAGSTSEGRLTTSSGTPILVSKTSRTLLRAPKRSERWLQELIHRHPDVSADGRNRAGHRASDPCLHGIVIRRGVPPRVTASTMMRSSSIPRRRCA